MSPFDHLLGQLRAAGEATRLRALLLLSRAELTVTELTRLLAQSQPRVSRHLKVLAEAGLVARIQEGSWVFYRLTESPVLDRLGLRGAQAAALLDMQDRDGLAALKAERAAAAAAYFAQIADDWDALRQRHVDSTLIEAALLEMAGPHIDTFVDLGTGTGRMLTVFRDQYLRGIGFDTSPEMLAIARANLADAGVTHAQVRRADIMEENLQVKADLICLHHVLHFLADPYLAIKTAAAMLRPGGKMLIADFAPHTHEDLREHYAHRRLGFGDEEITKWAVRAGLTVGATKRLDPAVDNGLVTRIWRLDDPRPRVDPSQHSTQQVMHAAL